MKPVRFRFGALRLAVACVALAGCGNVQLYGNVNPNAPTVGPAYGAVMTSPSSNTIIIAPNGNAVVLLQPAPGLSYTAQTFFNAFALANPNIVSYCTGIALISDGIASGLTTPTVQLTLTATGLGACAIPLNLGTSTVTLSLTVQ